jgi:hypothetical protein
VIAWANGTTENNNPFCLINKNNLAAIMSLRKHVFSFTLLYLTVLSSYACTIFVLTDERQTLFFNNEDWSNPVSRLWFTPSGENYFGCAYLGFDDGWAQGGVNDRGLSYDWVAGFDNEWRPDPSMVRVSGNPSERMLERCATVAEAIEFYKKHREPSFATSRIMIADKTGASVIIGARDGKLFFDHSTASRGFGYAAKILADRLSPLTEIGINSGLSILSACKQEGSYATKYSNVFNLRSGEITLVNPGNGKLVTLNIHEELKEGGHYYELSAVGEEENWISRPSLPNMLRFMLDNYPRERDDFKEITTVYSRVTRDAMAGELKADNFTSDFWDQIRGQQDNMKRDLNQLGSLESIKLLDVETDGSGNRFLFCLEFEYLRVVQWVSFEKGGRIALIRSLEAEPK